MTILEDGFAPCIQKTLVMIERRREEKTEENLFFIIIILNVFVLYWFVSNTKRYFLTRITSLKSLERYFANVWLQYSSPKVC